jgi:Winged helix DNA-binding domain
MTDDHRKRVCVGAVVEPTLLIDGQVVAIWKIVHAPARATLEVQPLAGVPATDMTTATQEGQRLLRFAAADAPDHDIRVLGPERRAG